MPHRLSARSADLSRDKRFWLIATAMAMGQLAAFWMLCVHQVREAQVWHAAVHIERVAVADCLRSVRGATLTSCAARTAPTNRNGIVTVGLERTSPGMQAAGARMGEIVPVNYVHHR